VESLLQVALLGSIEGITEFLPISSTGHLLIAEHWFGRRSDLFNVAIQTGAILAVVIIYWRRRWDLGMHFGRTENRSYVCKLAAAFAISVVGGFIAKKMELELADTIVPVAWAPVLGGFAIFAIEAYAKRLSVSDALT
jgi:undecaprenyl-diphosphatase